MAFKDVDMELIKSDSGYFRYIILGQLTHLHDCIHRVEKKVESLDEKASGLERWKLKVTTAASVVASIFTFILTFLFHRETP